MSFHTIQALHYVSFPEHAGPYTMLEKIGLHLATDRAYAQAYVQGNFAANLGEGQIAELFRHKAHLMFQATWVPPHLVQDTAEWSIRVQIQQSMLFLQSLWLVKDNSVNASEVYFATRNVPGGDIWSQGTPPLWFFTADCKLRETPFAKAEVDEAIAFYRTSSEDSANAPYDAYRPKPTVAMEKSRIGRGLLAVRYARAAEDIGIKCAFYCIALESLVATSNKEVANRMGRRVGTLLGKTDDEKLAIFDDVQSFYDRRSRVVHGDHLDDAATNDLFERLPKWDESLRKVFRLVLLDPELHKLFSDANKAEIDDYFMKRPFPEVRQARSASDPGATVDNEA